MKMTSKLHLVCANDELRPAMECVYFSDKYAYATDAHCLIRQNIDLFDLSEEEKKHIVGKFIHRDAWKDMCRTNVKALKAVKDGIRCFTAAGWILYPYIDPGAEPPNYEAALSFDKKEHTESIGINPKLLKNLQDAMLFENSYYKVVEVTIYAKNRGLKVVATSVKESDQIGLIMPVMIDRYEHE